MLLEDLLDERLIETFGREMLLICPKLDLPGLEKLIAPLPVTTESAVEAKEIATMIGMILIIVKSLQEFHHGFLFVAVKSGFGINRFPPVVITLKEEFVIDKISFTFV